MGSKYNIIVNDNQKTAKIYIFINCAPENKHKHKQ